MTGRTAVTLTANRIAAAAPRSALCSRPERDQQHVAGHPLQRPGRQLHRDRDRAFARAREHRQAGAHARGRVAPLRHPLRHPRRARRQPAADQRRRDQHEHEQDQRRQAVPEQRLLTAGEEPDRREHHGAEDHEREHVDQRLRHQRAEHDRAGDRAHGRAAAPPRARATARPAGRAASPTSARRSSCPARRRPSAGRASGIAAFRIACQDTARSSIEAHISASPSSTQEGEERTSASPIRSSPMCWTAR